MADVWNALVLSLFTLLGAPTPMTASSLAVVLALVAVTALVAIVAGHSHDAGAHGRTVFARLGAGRAPIPAQADPDAAGHARPRAPSYAASAA